MPEDRRPAGSTCGSASAAARSAAATPPRTTTPRATPARPATRSSARSSPARTGAGASRTRSASSSTSAEGQSGGMRARYALVALVVIVVAASAGASRGATGPGGETPDAGARMLDLSARSQRADHAGRLSAGHRGGRRGRAPGRWRLRGDGADRCQRRLHDLARVPEAGHLQGHGAVVGRDSGRVPGDQLRRAERHSGLRAERTSSSSGARRSATSAHPSRRR